MNILIYLIKMVLISGMLLGYYWLFLRNRFFHGFNRYFLLSIPVLSFLLPALHLNMPAFWNHSSSGSPIHLLGVGQGTLEDAVTIYASRQTGKGLPLELMLIILSLIITAFLFTRSYKSIRFIHRLRKEKPFLILREATVYFVSEKGTPFSFFKSIFWEKELELESESGKQILEHEIFHVKNNHSLDILSLEMLRTVIWFNPFLYLIQQEIKAIHEYAADAWVAAKTDTYKYASLLLLKVSTPARPLTHPFFKNQIKRRITMMTKSKKKKAGLLGRFMILPLITILIGLFSFRMHNSFHLLSAKPIRVVIDAGHGGSFIGTQYDGVLEKNINLIIAKKIQSLASQYNVDVIMSRETDATPGSTELHESLKYVAELSKNKNADLFISIHTNSTEDGHGKIQYSKSGFQIYIPRSSSEVYEGSLKLGSIMTETIKSDYTIEPELKQAPGDGGNIYILKNATVPALLIECGYMDNPGDLKYLQDDKNQEKIARDILEGIRKYSLQSATACYTPKNQTDTLSYEEYEKMDPNTISGVATDSKNDYLTVHLTNGKTAFVKITEATREKWAVDLKNNQASPVLTQVEVEAEFPGGAKGWYDYLVKNLKYPESAVSNEIQGEVMVEFIVQKSGTLVGIHAVSGPEQLRTESVRIVKESGKWIPAKNNGDIVESFRRQPINYKLEQK